MLKRSIALELAYQRRLGQLDASDEEHVDVENEARRWAEMHYRDENYNFIEGADKVTEIN